MFSLLRYYGTVTTCTVNCCSNVDIIASHVQHHQGDPICHNINACMYLSRCVIKELSFYIINKNNS
jgi:hypothetical protein